jgi:hypothetical protein
MSTESVTTATGVDAGDAAEKFDEHDAKALTQYLTVLEDHGPARGREGRYVVVSQSGSEYLVDADAGRCECPDHEYRGVRCKHLRRVEFAIGARPLPAWIDREAVDSQLGDHVDGSPRTVSPGREEAGQA